MIIDYFCVSNRGLVRENNQDNFICCGKYMELDKADEGVCFSGSVNSGESSVFGIFDGMGGEEMGEMAAYIAASLASGYAFDSKDSGSLVNFCLKANSAVVDYSVNEVGAFSGSTAALLMFSDESVHICNMGDSRIYRIRDNTLNQLSIDHVIPEYQGKSPLTLCLGIPEEDLRQAPYSSELSCKSGDRYIICSDGLSDMLEDELILSLGSTSNPETAAKFLLHGALKHGGIDNISFILLAVK